MSRRRRIVEDDLMPGLDGWIRLKPGETYAWDVLDPVPSPNYPQQQEAMRQIRGGILGFGFTIEEAIVSLILVEKFGTLDPKIGGDEFRARAKEFRGYGHGIERKLVEVRPIIRAALPRVEAERLIGDLAEYRRLRHLMAHRPCWLESIWDADAGVREGVPKGRTIGFKLVIADEDFVWEIDLAQQVEWRDLLNRCKSGLEQIRNRLLPPSASPTNA